MAEVSEQKSNLSFILNKVESLSFEERPIPKLSSPHDVLVAVNYTGICGSDVHYWLHGAIGPFVVKDPMVLGHESAGTVVEVGAGVSSLKVGDRVALEPGYPCRHCVDCLAGQYNLCVDMRFAATPPYDGTLTGFWAAPADFCYKLPDNMSLQEGAFMEPLAVSVHVVKQGGVSPGKSVVVMGAGPVGLLIVAMAKAFGATTICSVDIIPAKLELAKQCGATHTYLSQRIPAEENARNVIDLCGLGRGADVVIDASGAEPSIQAALHVVRVGGTYVQAGMGKSDITFPIMALCAKEVTAKGSFRYSGGDYRVAIQMVESGRVDVKPLISETVAFKDAEVAFNKVKKGEVIKILIAGPNEKLEGTPTEAPPVAAPEPEPPTIEPVAASAEAADASAEPAAASTEPVQGQTETMEVPAPPPVDAPEAVEKKEETAMDTTTETEPTATTETAATVQVVEPAGEPKEEIKVEGAEETRPIEAQIAGAMAEEMKAEEPKTEAAEAVKTDVTTTS